MKSEEKKYTATVTFNLHRKIQPVDGYFVFVHYDDELSNDAIIELAKEKTKSHPLLNVSDIKDIHVTGKKQNTQNDSKSVLGYKRISVSQKNKSK